MKFRRIWFALLLAGLALLAPTLTMAQQSAVTGTVRYNDKALPPANSVLTVQLLDVSQADTAAKVISEVRISVSGKAPPYAFTLPYDPTLINQSNIYVVGARINSGSTLIWLNTAQTRVITAGNPTNVDIVLTRVGSLPNTASSSWLLVLGAALMLAAAGVYGIRRMRARSLVPIKV